MKQETYFLVLDVGTSGIKALVFTKSLKVVGRAYKEINKLLPQKGFVEQDPQELVAVSISVIKQVVREQKITPKHIVAMGITNQRETTILWDKKTGQPVYPAIVWEDERTTEECSLFKKHEQLVRKLTGLTILPYFSASKIAWILSHVPQTKNLLQEKRLLFGTVDSWIMWNLSKQKVHVTDYTNASRTLLFNINDYAWDKKLLEVFSLSSEILPQTLPSFSQFATLKKEILGEEIPMLAVVGDQQSSMYATGTETGKTKATYGTGTFILQVIGEKFLLKDRFFTTIVPLKKGFGYALEAKIDATGQTVAKHLQDKVLLRETIDRIVHDAAVVIKNLPIVPKEVTVDGGITREAYLIKKQQELLGIPVVTHETFDGTALGVAKLLQDSLY
jgi:glycerol kinase